ncbi:MAG: hypothetical protein HW391_1998 [Chloroflexi bacterium]|nr:hypothetical protein [Chloroflexota bacterium]
MKMASGLKVQVDAVRAAVANCGGDLFREVGPGRVAAEQGRLGRLLARRPRKAADRQHDSRSVLVCRVDDRGHPRTRPATPAGRDGPIRGLLDEVAVPVRPHAEVGHRGQHPPVERRRAVGELPVREEPEHLAPKAGRANDRLLCCGGIVRQACPGRPGGGGGASRRAHRAVDRRVGAGSRRCGAGLAAGWRSLGPDRALACAAHLATAHLPRGKSPGPSAANLPPVPWAGREARGDSLARDEFDDVVCMRERVLVVDGRLQGAPGRRDGTFRH